jgi:hypothetical protein
MSIEALDADQYHADPAPQPSLSSSIARILLEQSPMHAWLAHPKLNPRYVRESDSRFDLGSAAHLMLLERREDAIVRVDADDWRTKAAKEAREQAQALGQYAVLERQYHDIVTMCEAARKFIATTELAGILDEGDAEQTLLFQDGGVWCRARPDVMSKDRKVLLDYKSTTSAQPEAFARQIGRMGYDLQAEFYSRGIEVETGHLPAFVFLAQEITPPYACSLVSLSNSYRFVGQAKVMRATALWAKCVKENSWPAYGTEICYAEPKPWDLAIAEEITL